MNTIDERYEEIVDQYLCDDEALLKMARRIAELEAEVVELEESVEYWQGKVSS